jgi:hypothetical protein
MMANPIDNYKVITDAGGYSSVGEGPVQPWFDGEGTRYDAPPPVYTPPSTKYIDKTTGKEVSAREYRSKTNQSTATEKLSNQILGQGLTGKWSGQGHGSAESNAEDMARILDSIGITDVKQLGKVPIYEPADVKFGYKGKIAKETEDGGVFYIENQVGFNEDYMPIYDRQYIDKDQLKPIYGKTNFTIEGETGETVRYDFEPLDPSQLIMKNGVPVYKAREDFGNKLTGQAVPNTYSERQGGDFFGGTFAGKGNTGYGVKFKPDGTPIFYTQGASSNDLVNLFQMDPLLGTVAQVAASYFGGPMGTAALNAAMGKSPQDILKAAALSYAGNAAGSAISGMEGITDILGETGTNIASNVAKQFVGSGGQNVDPVKALLGSGLVSGLTGGSGDGPNSADFEEGFFRPGGGGYMDPSGGESVFDPTFGGVMPMGPGYIDEETGKFISDPLGGLQGPLGPETGNFDPNKEWEYSLTKPGVWTSKDGQEIDLSYMPDRDTAMTGKELMDRAGVSSDSLKTGAKPAAPGAKPAAPGSKIPGAAGLAPGAAGAAGALGTAGANALPGLAQQQTSNADLLNFLSSQDKGANIKSYKELFGEDLFGGKYVPPSASGDQSEGPANYGRRDESSTASQSEAEEQLFRGGHVDDFDADALLQILRS